jgi:glycosyltransferase involved in cell wall biosynthesis
MLSDAGFLYTAPTATPSRDGKVAIILRTRDRPILLRRALQDILAQTYTNWHIQLVNDGGDATILQTLLETYATALSARFTLHNNLVSVDRPAAINQGLASAEAAFFVVHDDDDTWDTEFLSATVALLDQPENAALIGATALYSRVNERIEGEEIVRESCHPVRLSDDFADITKQMVLNRLVPIGVLFRMSLLYQIGLFNPDMLMAEDWEFSVRALLVGDFGVVPRPLAYHHVRPESSDSAYNNSIVTDGGLPHKRYTMLARNNMIRRAIAARPELLGLLQPLTHAIYDNVDYACRRIAHEHKSQSEQIYGFARLMTEQHADFATRLAVQIQSQEARMAAIERELAALRGTIMQVLAALPQETVIPGARGGNTTYTQTSATPVRGPKYLPSGGNCDPSFANKSCNVSSGAA